MTRPEHGLVDPEALAAWLDDHHPAGGLPLTCTPLAGGASNAMFTVRRGDRRWVLRRPAGVAAGRADQGLAREYRILDALAGTAVPHPAAVALCTDPAVLGCTFYLMEHVDGFAPLPHAIPAHLDTDEGRRAIGLAMVDALADLHAVAPAAVGLGDLGNPEGFHERQVARWTAELERHGGPGLPGIATVTSWLTANLPEQPFTPVLMHGDYHFGNVLVAADQPTRVTAIIDWETATLGDPLLDLAAFLRIWFDTGPHRGSDRAEMVARYESRSGRQVPDLTYYFTLARFRLAVLLEGIHQRSLRDPTRAAKTALGTYARRLIEEAADAVCGTRPVALDGSGDPGA